MPDLPNLPLAVEAEEALLGAMLLDHDSRAVAYSIVQSSDYLTDERRRIVWDMLEELGQCDLVTLGGVLKDRGLFERAGGTNYLMDLAEAVPSTANVGEYARMVRDAYHRRQYVQAAEHALQDLAGATPAYGDDYFWEIAEKVADGLAVHCRARRIYKDLTMIQLLEQPIQRSGLTVTTGYSAIDRDFSGIRRGEYVIVAARPSVGKSCLMGNIIHNAAERNQRSVIYTLEMAPVSWGHRLMARYSQVEQWRIRRGELDPMEYRQVNEARPRINQIASMISFGPADCRSTRQINGHLQQVIRSGSRPDIVVIDYVQLLEPSVPAKSVYEGLSHSSAAIQSMAINYGICFLVGCQLSRSSDKTRNIRPSLHSLRDSGKLEEHADVVMLLHDTTPASQAGLNDHDLLLICAKHRNGRRGEAELRFHQPYQEIVQLTKEQEVPF